MIKKGLTVRNMDTDFVSKLINTSEKFKSQILIHYKTRLINAKSVMGVMAIAEPGIEMNMVFMCDGRDEKKAMQAIEELIENYGNEEVTEKE